MTKTQLSILPKIIKYLKEKNYSLKIKKLPMLILQKKPNLSGQVIKTIK